jgi:hypothetical protein
MVGVGGAQTARLGSDLCGATDGVRWQRHDEGRWRDELTAARRRGEGGSVTLPVETAVSDSGDMLEQALLGWASEQ